MKLPVKSAKLKAVFLTEDGGETWTCIRQYYLTSLRDNTFLSTVVQGMKLKQHGESNEQTDDQRS